MTDIPDMVDIPGISDITSLPRTYVRDTLVRKPEFPRPVLNLSQKTRRWDKGEVVEWLAREVARNRR